MRNGAAIDARDGMVTKGRYLHARCVHVSLFQRMHLFCMYLCVFVYFVHVFAYVREQCVCERVCVICHDAGCVFAYVSTDCGYRQ